MTTRSLEELKESIEKEDYSAGLLKAASAFEQLRNQAMELAINEEAENAQADYEVFNFYTATPFIGQDSKDRLIPLFASADGSSKWPDITSFTEDRLKYYETRMNITSNPFLKARYADVLFEGWNRCLKKNKREIGEVLLESLLLTGSLQLGEKPPHYLEFVQDLARALDIALKVGLRDRIPELADKLISVMDDFRDDDTKYVYHVSAIMRGIATSKLSNILTEDRYQACADSADRARAFFWVAKDYLWHREFCNELAAWGKILKWDESRTRKYLVGVGESLVAQGEYAASHRKSNMMKAHYLAKAAKHFIDIGEQGRLDNLKVSIKATHEQMEASAELSQVSFEFRILNKLSRLI